MIVCDTNVLSEPTKAHPDPRVLAWFAAHADEVVLTAINVQELRYGLALLPNGSRKRDLVAKVDGLVAQLPEALPYDSAAAAVCGRLLAAMRQSGSTIARPEDVQLASIAKTCGATLATRNTKHFHHAGLHLVNPWESTDGHR